MLSDEAMQEFKDLLETKCNYKASDEETRKMATDFLELMELIYKSIPNDTK